MITIKTALTIAMVLTVVGLICACIRLIIGPSRADRVVSLDLITILLVAIAGQLAILYEVAAYLDLGLAIGLIGFLATIAFARYIENASNVQIAAEPDLTNTQPTTATHVQSHDSTENEVRE